MFVRLKKLKKYNYAYLVVNTWTKKGPRQKVKKYLGRVYEPKKIRDLKFVDYYKIKDIEAYIGMMNPKTILSKVFELELLKHGFEKDTKGILHFEELEAKPKTFKLYSKKQKNSVVLKINDGFLCETLVKKVLRFKFKGEDEDSYSFANLILMAGLDIDKEVFVELFQKMSS